METLFIILCIFFLMILTVLLIECTSINSRKGWHSYLSILFIYQLFFSTWIGTLIVALEVFNPPRLSAITYETKVAVFYFVSYSIIIIFLFYAFFSLIKELFFLSTLQQQKNVSFAEISEKKQEYYLSILKGSVLIQFLYITIKYIFFSASSPLLTAFTGDSIGAALMRKSIQSGELTIDLPYIGKFIYFLCIFNVVLSYLLYMLNNRKLSFLMFVFIFILSCSNLLFDGQKAPLLLLVMLLFIVYIQFKKIDLRSIFILTVMVTLLSFFYYVLMGGGSGFISILARIFDRIVAGQNQAMYFIYQFYEPKLTGVFSDLPFSRVLGLREIKPDEAILPYIYKDLSGLVNSNTFFQGEAWAFGGEWGIIIAPFLVSINLIFYILFFDYLMKFDFLLFWVIALIFFSTLPINQSLQFILYQKYFLYFVCLFILPLLFLLPFIRARR